MTAPFIHREGDFGERIIRPQTNLRHANTAHMIQGLGAWVPEIAAENLAILADPTAPFGGSSLRWQAIGAGTWNVVSPINFPIVGGQPYSGSVWVKSPQLVNSTFRIHTDSGSAPGPVIAVPADTWTQLTSSFVTQGDATVVNPWLSMNWDEFPETPDGIQYQASAYLLREGLDQFEFVPSTDITGSLEMEIDALMLPWDQAGFATVLGTRAEPLVGYAMAIHPGPAVQVWYSDGVTERSHEQPITVTEARHRIKATFDQPAGTWRFYVDDVQQGADVTGFTTDPGIPANGLLSIGANVAGANSLPADWFAASVRDGLDGPKVYNLNAEDVMAGVGP